MLPGLHVCCRHLKHRFQPILNSSPDPKKLPPDGASYSASAVSPVFARCAQSALVTVQRGLAERDHTEPKIVLIQLPTPRLDNSPWREGPQKWIGPLALTFFPVHLPPDWRGRGPHSWAPSPVPVLLATSSWPVFSNWTLIIYLLHGRLFDLVSPPNAVLEPTSTCDQKSDHLRSEDISHCSCWAHFISQKVCWSRNKSNDIWADAVEPSHQSNTTHKTTLLHRKYCRSLTREGKSESLLTSNKSV